MSARFVAAFRLVIAVIVIAAIWVDPAQPARISEVGYAFLATFFVWAGVNLWAAYRHWWVEFQLSRPALRIDVSVGVLLVVFTEGAAQDFASPLAAILMFVLLEAAFLGGWRLTASTGVQFVLGMLLVALLLGLLGVPIDPLRIARRVGFFLLMTSLAVWFASRRTAPVVPAFAPDPNSRETKPVGQAIEFARAALGAAQGFAIWEPDDEAEATIVMGSGPADLTWRGASTAVVAVGLPTASPALVRCGRRWMLRLNEEGACQPGSGCDLTGLGVLNDGADAISIPVQGEGVTALIVVYELHAVTRDLLPIARSVGGQIEAGLNRHALAISAMEDRIYEVRQSIARDLHDSVAQSLAGASFRVEAARKGLADGIDPVAELDAVHQALHSEQRHVRGIIDRLRRGSDVRFRHPLSSDLEVLLPELEEQWRVKILFQPLVEPFEVGTAQLHEIRQIAREAVANAARHGKAQVVRFAIDVQPEWFHLDIVDDGNTVDGSSHPFEPRSIAERVTALGGKLDARRGGVGAKLHITVPRLSA